MKLPITAQWSEPNRHYRLRDANGEIVAHTRGHTEALLAALNALPACKEALEQAELYILRWSPCAAMEPLQADEEREALQAIRAAAKAS